jgi:hypothetical protein
LRYRAAIKVRTSSGEYRIVLKHRATAYGLPMMGCVFDLLKGTEEVSDKGEKNPELAKKKRSN